MGNSIQNDQITTALLEKAGELRTLINSDDFGLREELDASAEMTACINELENVFRSLEQYSRSERNLRYLALVGHYSAGKSSTINSLLGNDVRSIDLHPTDQGVTFIGHTENSKKILPAESKGELTVQVSLLDHAVLNETVLIDTPGTGDPSKVGAMVKDVLPLASMLLYLINATNPFDESDLPNMMQIFTELGHIPFKFVITRSDVFRLDKDAPVSTSNMDKLEQSKFAATFIARLRSESVALNVTEDDLIFIDNEAGFGIDNLIEEAVHRDIDTNKIHINTLHFYMRRLKQAQTKILKWSQHIDSSVDGLLQKASDNRAKFDENTGISTDALMRALSTNHVDLAKRVKDDNQTLSKWVDANTQISGPNEPELKAFVTSVISMFKTELANALADIVRQEAADNFRKYAMRKYDLHEADSDWRKFDNRIDVERIDISGDDLEDTYRSAIISLADRMVDNWEILVRDVINDANELESRLSEFDEFLKNNATARSEIGRFQEFEKALQNAIQRFLETVKMYQVAVLAYRMKELAEHVSLGKALDELEEDNLDEDVIDKIKSDLIDQVFGNRNAIHSQFDDWRKLHRDKVADIRSALHSELSILKSISKDLPLRTNVATELLDKVDRQALEQLAKQLTLEHVKNLAKAFNKAVVLVIDEQVKLAGDAAQERSIRRAKLIRNVSLATFALGIFATIGVWTSEIVSFWGTFGNWAASAFFGVAFPFASGSLVSIFNPKPSSADFPDGRRAVRAELLRARDELPLNINGANILNRFEDHLFADLKSSSTRVFEEARASISEACKRLNEHIQSFASALKTMSGQTKETMTILLDWHEPSDEKTGWIQDMSAQIKELSIEPSFEVLRTKKASVHTAVDEIESRDVNVSH